MVWGLLAHSFPVRIHCHFTQPTAVLCQTSPHRRLAACSRPSSTLAGSHVGIKTKTCSGYDKKKKKRSKRTLVLINTSFSSNKQTDNTLTNSSIKFDLLSFQLVQKF